VQRGSWATWTGLSFSCTKMNATEQDCLRVSDGLRVRRLVMEEFYVKSMIQEQELS
jgi:hypothetical protein